MPNIVPLWDGPSRSSKPFSSLLLLADPGRGLRVFYAPPRGGVPTPFVPDMMDGD